MTTNMFIPYVFGNVTAEKITDVIQNYELLGTVDHVDVIPSKTQLPGKPPHSMAFIHMKSWFNNTHAQTTLKTIRDGGKHKIYYESFTKITTGREPFWTVIQNTKPKKEPAPEDVAKPYPLVREMTMSMSPPEEMPPPMMPPALTRTITSGVQTRTVPRPIFSPDGHLDWNEEDEDEISTPPPPTSPPPTQPPRLVRQNATYKTNLRRETSSTSTVYEQDCQARNLELDFENANETETETDGLVHESYVKKIEDENAKLNARIRSVLWELEKRFAANYFVCDLNLSFDQLEMKYGPLTWNTETNDYTDINGFIRRIVDPKANAVMVNHMETWRCGVLNNWNMTEKDRKLHDSYLRVKL
jgi:hypothetical protein